MHYVLLQVLERDLATGMGFDEALSRALETFAHYWLPINIEAITEPVPRDGWLPGNDYNTLRTKGLETIRRYADLLRFDHSTLLATEYSFMVPIDGTWDDELGEPHWLAGSVDRLAGSAYRGRPIVGIFDLKTGVQPKFLRQQVKCSADSEWDLHDCLRVGPGRRQFHDVWRLHRGHSLLVVL
jgi:hypothetical protein